MARLAGPCQYAPLLVLGLAVFRCGDGSDSGQVHDPNVPRASVTPSPSAPNVAQVPASGRKNDQVGEKAAKMITESKAIEIAEATIKGKVTTQKDSPTTAVLKDGKYTVTFVYITPPGVKGPDYDARVVIDASTGEVKEFLVGP
jgi:Peptidase propeptide and YPEB domain